MLNSLLSNLEIEEKEKIANAIPGLIEESLKSLEHPDKLILFELIKNGIEEENENMLFLLQIIFGLYDPNDIEYILYEEKN